MRRTATNTTAELTWSLGDVPPDARSAALRSAQQEGVPIGEWMTRQILEGFREVESHQAEKLPGEIGERLTNLATRLERLETHLDTNTMAQTVQRMHDSLSHVSDEVGQTANRSAAQISELAAKLDALTRALAELQSESSHTTSGLRQQLAQAVDQLAVQISALTGNFEVLSLGKTNAERQTEQRLAQTQTLLETLNDRQDHASRSVAGTLASLAHWLEHSQSDIHDLIHRLEQRVDRAEKTFESIALQKGDSQALADRMAALEEKFETVRGSAADSARALDLRVADLRRELEHADVRQNGTSHSLAAGLQTLKITFEELLQHASGRDDALETRLEHLRHCFQDLSAQQGDAAMDANGRLEQVRREAADATGALARQVTVGQEEMKALDVRQRDATSRLEQTLDALQCEITRRDESVKQSLDGVGRTLGEIDVRLGGAAKSLSSRLDTLDARFDEAQSLASATAGSLEQRIQFVEQSGTEQGVRHDEALRAVTGDLAILGEQFGENRRDGLDTVAALDGRLLSIQQVLTEQESRHDEALQGVGDHLGTLANRFENAQARVRESEAGLEQKIADLRQDLVSLDVREQASTESISATLAALGETQEHAQVGATQSLHALGEQLRDLHDSLQHLGARQDAAQRGLDEKIDEFGRISSEKLAALEPHLEHMQRILEDSDVRHEAACQSLNERLEDFRRSLRQARDQSSAELAELAQRITNSNEELAHSRSCRDDDVRALAQLDMRAAALLDTTSKLERELVEFTAQFADASSETRITELSQRVAEAVVRQGIAEALNTVDARFANLESRPHEAPAGMASVDAALQSAAGQPPLEEHVLGPSIAEEALLPVAAITMPHSGEPLHKTTADDCASTEAPPDTSPQFLTPEDATDAVPIELPPFPEIPSIEVVPVIAPECEVTSGVEEKTPAASYISAARRAAKAAADRQAPGKNHASPQQAWGRRLAQPRATVRNALLAAVSAVFLLAAGSAFLLRQTTRDPNSNVTSLAHSRSRAVTHHHHLKISRQISSASRSDQRAASALVARPLPQTAAASALSDTGEDPAKLLSLANAGNVHAQLVLGMRAFEDRSSLASGAEAAKWLAMAAAHGDAVASYHLGLLYWQGRGVAPDSAKAMDLYRVAAALGNREAMNNLGVAYAQGKGVAKDLEEAVRWFSNAAQLGLVEAQFDLAVLYERGSGVRASLADAYRWYAIAAREGDRESKIRAEAIGSEIPAQTRAAADGSAARFVPLPMDRKANNVPQL